MKHHWLGGLTLKTLARKVWHAANEDDFFGAAAKLSYYFLLALFPMLIFLTSLVGFLPGVQQKILLTLAEVAPGEAMALLLGTLNDVVSKTQRRLAFIRRARHVVGRIERRVGSDGCAQSRLSSSISLARFGNSVRWRLG